MKKIYINTVLILLLSFGITACGTFMGSPPGLLYSNITANKQFEAGSATSPAGAWVTGRSCTYSILMLASWGDSGLDAAMENAGIKGQALRNVIVDHSFVNIVGPIFMRYCTVISAYVPVEKQPE